MNFRVGQKVVCVDAKSRRFPCTLKEGNIYTIAGHVVGGSAANVFLVEAKARWHPDFGFFSDRFRPLVTRKTSIEIFTRMLTPNQQKVKA